MVNYWKARTIPEYPGGSTIDVPLAVAAADHWNQLKDPVYPACLLGFQKKHEASKGITPEAGLPTTETASTSTASSSTHSAATSETNEVAAPVKRILQEIFAVKVETMQDMGFIRETDQALARAFATEFARLQLIVGEDLNTSLRGLKTSVMTSLVDKLTSHEQRIQDLVLEHTLEEPEVSLQVLVGLGAYQPIDTKLFPGIMEGLLGSLGIDVTGGGNPPTSSKEGVARR